MPHHCADLILSWLASQNATSPSSHTLDPTVSEAARPALDEDARGLFYSSALSVIGAMEGVRQARFSWSIVQLYYAAFYSARSVLASNGVSIFYESRAPYSVTVQAGSNIRKEKDRSTHKLVWKVFQREFGNNPLLNDINGVPAHEWLTKLREKANYNDAKFPDPLLPSCFAQIDTVGIGPSLKAYVEDKTFLYAFDPDHALLAFPIECMKLARSAYLRTGAELEDDELTHIRAGCTSIGAAKNILLY